MTQLTPAQAFHEAQRLLRMGEYPRAGSLTQQLVQNLPDEPIIRGLHGATLARLGRAGPGLTMMEESLEKAEQERFRTFLAIECAVALARLNRLDEALAMTDRAAALDATSPEVRGARADALIDLGRFDEAAAYLAAHEDGDTAGPAIAFGRLCLLTGRPADGLERVSAAARRVGVTAVDLERLLRVLGQLCERTERFDEAFDAWRRAARLKKAAFDAPAHRKLTGQLVSQWSPEALSKLTRPTAGGERQVFLIGAPGAGHGLVESVLAAHPAVFGCGDLGVLQRVVKSELDGEKTAFGRTVLAPGRLKGRQLNEAARVYTEDVSRIAARPAERAVDAQPHSFYHAGIIPLAMPEARVVFCSREPVESALSVYASVSGAPYAQDLEDLGSFTGDAVRLCDHWRSLFDSIGARWHEVRYEDLVSATPPTVAGLLKFLDLEFDDACLSPERHATTRAPLSDDLRLPIEQQVHARGERHAGRTKALRAGVGQD